MNNMTRRHATKLIGGSTWRTISKVDSAGYLAQTIVNEWLTRSAIYNYHRP